MATFFGKYIGKKIKVADPFNPYSLCKYWPRPVAGAQLTKPEIMVIRELFTIIQKFKPRTLERTIYSLRVGEIDKTIVGWIYIAR